MSTESAIQRPLRGSRISTFYPVKSLPSISSLDSAFQLQEYISLLIRLDVHDVDVITSLPGTNKDKESKAGEGEETKDAEGDAEKDKESKEVTVDEACWIYEQLRRLAQDLTHPLITTLQQECSRSSCPEMKAGEWLYLCVAHGNDGATEQCCAIDYILHTLDSATALLNSPRAFPSRLQIPASSHRHFSSLARRLGRIFAHAYFHHREAFEQAEAESSLYARFLALTSKFDLVPSEFLVIPSAPTGTMDDDEEYDEHGRDAGFGLREAKLGTSYDPRRGLGQQQQQQTLQHRETSDDFTGIPRARQPLQPQQPPQPYEIQSQLQGGQQQQGGGVSGVDSPRRVGRNRTDTMVHSEIASVVDDLAKTAAGAGVATAKVGGDEEREREEREEKEVKEEREREAREREKAETEEREKAEAEARAKAEAREKAENQDQETDYDSDDLDESKVPEPEATMDEQSSAGEGEDRVASPDSDKKDSTVEAASVLEHAEDNVAQTVDASAEAVEERVDQEQEKTESEGEEGGVEEVGEKAEAETEKETVEVAEGVQEQGQEVDQGDDKDEKGQ